MVAETHSRLVPVDYLTGARCPLPGREGETACGVRERPDRLAPRAMSGRSRPPVVYLTPAEFRVVELVCRGCSNKEIAGALGKAEATIKNQLAAVMRKFGVQSRCQLIVRLLRGEPGLVG